MFMLFQEATVETGVSAAGRGGEGEGGDSGGDEVQGGDFVV